MMKKTIWLLACAAILSACGKTPDTPTPQDSITGAWELASISTKATVGSETVSVYLSFDTAGAFELYQKIGAGRYTHFSGAYDFDQENKLLQGTYAGGSGWGPYTVDIAGAKLSLTTPGGKEVDTYNKIDSIPADVIANVY